MLYFLVGKLCANLQKFLFPTKCQVLSKDNLAQWHCSDAILSPVEEISSNTLQYFLSVVHLYNSVKTILETSDAVQNQIQNLSLAYCMFIRLTMFEFGRKISTFNTDQQSLSHRHNVACSFSIDTSMVFLLMISPLL